MVRGADGDLILGDCLIDANTTIRSLRRDWIYQLIGYVLLDFDDIYGIRSVGLYHARVSAILSWDLQEMLDEAAGEPVDFASLGRDFLKALPTTRGANRSRIRS